MESVTWPAGGGIAALIRARDWERTPLGPIAGWPAGLRALVDMLLRHPAPSVLLWGREGTMIYNEGYAQICGNKHPRVLGLPLREAWPEAWDFNGRMLANCLAGHAEVHKHAGFVLERDGVMRDAWFDLYYGPVLDCGGAVAGVMANVIEITDQVKAEQLRELQRRQLDQTTARLVALTNATADVVYRMSADWHEMRHLDGRGFIKDTADPRRSWVREYVPADEQPRVLAAIDKAIRTRTPFVLEHRVLRIDGSIGWTLSRAVPMTDARGEIQEWVGTASDITERKVAEEKLRESDRRKDEFLAMLAHELRNPLAPIGTAAELLQTMTLDEQRIRRTSQVIGRQVGHMTELIDDLLDVSRVTRGLITLEMLPLDTAQIIEEAVEQAAPLINARHHTLLVEPAPRATLVMGDKKRLVQVVSNLLNNAAKYTREGGTIRIKTAIVDAQLTIGVMDNGAGMSARTAAHAFDLFSQAERTSDRSTGGLGLGLALVKSLVELHGGSVACASAGLGHGSTFEVRLPRLESGNAQAAAPGAGAVAPDQRPLWILVVDDNVDAAEMLAMLLEAAGHHVAVEHAPETGLVRARELRPQVCLIDIGLPGMDGYAMARRLRGQPETAQAVLVAVTGYGQGDDLRRSREAGFDHHLVKPVDPQALYALLAAAGLPSR